MNGFISANLIAIRSDSSIVLFILKTISADSTEISRANEAIKVELNRDYGVFEDSFTALYTSPRLISYTPQPMYSGGVVTMSCGPPPSAVKIGSWRAEWKFKGQIIRDSGRYRMHRDSAVAKLDIRDAVTDDSGTYGCSLIGRVMDFIQEGPVKVGPAPVIRTKTRVNFKCIEDKPVPILCCVNLPHKAQLKNMAGDLLDTVEAEKNCIRHDYLLMNCDEEQEEIRFTCEADADTYEKEITLIIFSQDVVCEDENGYGSGRQGDRSIVDCDDNEVGQITASCEASGGWEVLENTCTLIPIMDRLTVSQDLTEEVLLEFMDKLLMTIEDHKGRIVKLPMTISVVVSIMTTVVDVLNTANQRLIKGLLQILDVLMSDGAKGSWTFLNNNNNRNLNVSSRLLASLESVLAYPSAGPFTVTANHTHVSRTLFQDSLEVDLSDGVALSISHIGPVGLARLTTSVFSSLHNVLPVRIESKRDESEDTINGRVLLVKLNTTVAAATLTFDTLDDALALNPKCVFWNYLLFDGSGAWDGTGCSVVSNQQGAVSCDCNHLTTFTILTSRSRPSSAGGSNLYFLFFLLIIPGIMGAILLYYYREQSLQVKDTIQRWLHSDSQRFTRVENIPMIS